MPLCPIPTTCAAVAGAQVPEVNNSHWHKEGRIKRCTLCGQEKGLTQFYAYGYVTRQGKQSTRYESRCKPCAVARRLERYAKCGEHEREYHREWIRKNDGHVKAYARSRQQDPVCRAIKAKSQRLRKARLRSGQSDDPEIKAIYAEAIRVEALIQNCPVFDLPELGKKIHVDHIMPLSKGGRHVASNLQLLPIGLNMRKGSKCPK